MLNVEQPKSRLQFQQKSGIILVYLFVIFQFACHLQLTRHFVLTPNLLYHFYGPLFSQHYTSNHKDNII